MRVATAMIMAVAMVGVPMPAQYDKDESIDQDPHQSQNEHYCTHTPKYNAATSKFGYGLTKNRVPHLTRHALHTEGLHGNVMAPSASPICKGPRHPSLTEKGTHFCH